MGTRVGRLDVRTSRALPARRSWNHVRGLVPSLGYDLRIGVHVVLLDRPEQLHEPFLFDLPARMGDGVPSG